MRLILHTLHQKIKWEQSCEVNKQKSGITIKGNVVSAFSTMPRTVLFLPHHSSYVVKVWMLLMMGNYNLYNYSLDFIHHINCRIIFQKLHSAITFRWKKGREQKDPSVGPLVKLASNLDLSLHVSKSGSPTDRSFCPLLPGDRSRIQLPNHWNLMIL